jgi:hypothetical protein
MDCTRTSSEASQQQLSSPKQQRHSNKHHYHLGSIKTFSKEEP